MVTLKVQIGLSFTLFLMGVTMAADFRRLKPRKHNDFMVATKPAASTALNIKHKDCHEWRNAGARKSGVYEIYPNRTYAVKVHCEHGINASYTIIQRRMDGKVNFDTNWSMYKEGFGSYTSDYWVGLDTINHLTTSGNNKLLIEMVDWSGFSVLARYSNFTVLDEHNLYRMYVSGYSGFLPDDLAYNNGMPFATPDRPDTHYCAVNQRAGWWFNSCSFTLPNGFYYSGGPYTPTSGFYDGIYWKDWKGYGYSMKYVSLQLYQ